MNKFHRTQFSLVLSVVGLLAGSGSFLSAAGATAPPVTHETSYVAFDSGTTTQVSGQSPCASGICDNGERITWSPGQCYQGGRYRPIAIVFTINGNLATSEWPLTAPCSTGFQFSWDKNNQLDDAQWVGTSAANQKVELAVCFQSKTECNAGHCVTAGCLPAHVNGVDLFFQGADSPTGASWLLNGKVDTAITLSGSPNNVFWYGSTPPATPFPAAPTTGPTTNPSVRLTGRNSHGNPDVITDAAPSG